ncbi:MAG TPA: hypothetical protein VFB19_07905 [Mycobacterium sp.]|nr:hypothetical protein [Mycobacterium sp.]
MSNMYGPDDPTTYSTHADDATMASAWSSSLLGDPTDDLGGEQYRPLFPPDPIAPVASPKFTGKGAAALAAGFVGAIGLGAVVGVAVVVSTTSSEPRPVPAAARSTGVPAAVTTVAAPAPVVTLPETAPAPAPVVIQSDDAPVPAPVIVRSDSGPPPPDPGPPAGPGTPPEAPSGPVVVVNAPPIWLPQFPPPPPSPPPPACKPPHHLVHSVCK